MEFDDLKSPICRFESKQPDVDSKQIHIVMWESCKSVEVDTSSSHIKEGKRTMVTSNISLSSVHNKQILNLNSQRLNIFRPTPHVEGFLAKHWHWYKRINWATKLYKVTSWMMYSVYMGKEALASSNLLLHNYMVCMHWSSALTWWVASFTCLSTYHVPCRPISTI